ncbi:serine/threonine-protein kinase [Dokdonella sp.]|uniref:serine/threonine-protein kinase n=1 Tax=Dokdonella sp. TaxID=2291710 RepID=UPI0026327C1A|nr:serine/threonine-protein kinase [Dokdonella sp.]
MPPPSDLRRWFEHCLDLPADQRQAWIERNLCDADDRLRLRRLLAAAASGEAWLDEDIGVRIVRLLDGTDAATATFGGRLCGAFRLVRELGRGGQGIVYLAERAAGDFTQTVAVKLLRRAILSDHDLRSFRRERDILVRFDHPGVARLIDGGITDDGMPYLVMDYLDGTPLDAWCRRERPDRERTLALFSALCAIIAAAHRRLIVHRDLKPSNVLVMRDGAVKVLDFGIARLLDEDEDATRTQARLLTPGYAAPELFGGDAATPAADVYALGLMLRQMLDGDFADPRSRPVGTGRTAVPRELRWIIERATDAAAAQRYRDGAELGEDIDRYRNRLPVHAHPPGRWYRAGKFVARHRSGVAAAVLLVLSSTIGFGAALWQAHVARQQAALAAQEAGRATAVRGFVDRMFDAVRDGRARADEPSLRELVASAGDQVLQQPPRDAATAVDLATLFADLAAAGGDLDLASRLADTAVRNADAQLAAEDRLRIGAHVLRGYVASKREDYVVAEAELRPALADLDRLGLRGRPLLQALEGLQAVENMRGDAVAYIALARRDIDERRAAFGADDPALGIGFNNLGSALEGIEDYAGAQAAYAEATAFELAHRGPHNEATAEAECGLASTLGRAGRWREALTRFRSCTARFEALQHAPTQPEVYASAKWCVLEGWMLGERLDEACRRADEASARVFAGDRDYAGESRQRTASWMIERGVDYAQAEALLEQARALYGDGPLNAMRKGRVDQLRAELLLARGAYAQVRGLAPATIDHLRQRPFKLQPLIAQAQLLLACAHAPGPECGSDLRADIERRQAPLLAWRHPQMLQVQVLLARVDLERDPRAAAARLRAAVDPAAAELPALHPRLLEARLWLAAAQHRSGDCAGATASRLAADVGVREAGLGRHPLLQVARLAAGDGPCPAAGSPR